MEISNRILSDITVYMKYARYMPDLQRRESWNELVTRNKNMHLKKYPQLANEIEHAYTYVYDKKILPSMRSLQFGGKPIEISPNRIYNCAYLPIDDWRAFGETMFLLLGGTGVGYSVQTHHVEKLPEIRKPNANKHRRFLVADSIEGWADAVKMLMKSYFQGGSTINFDFSDIRPKGAQLITSGGKAPGPAPLRECLVKIQGILESKRDNDKLSPIEVHDIVCHIADAVLAGGIRRAALISLFSADDDDMIACKSGNWWEGNAQRGRANNSAVLLRNKITKDFFLNLWKKIEASGAGEPGIYLSNDKDWGTNPCCFIGETSIQTDNGVMTIKDIVDSINSGNSCNVKTFNEETGEIEIKPVLAGQLTKENATIVKMTVEEHGIQYSVECTPDHTFFTKNRGWVECKDLTQDDDIIIYQSLI
jgi:ribonucleoside-triphosphate reductase (thioredoxin)